MIVYAIKDRDNNKLMTNCILTFEDAIFGNGMPLLFQEKKEAEYVVSLLKSYNLKIVKVKIEEVEE